MLKNNGTHSINSKPIFLKLNKGFIRTKFEVSNISTNTVHKIANSATIHDVKTRPFVSNEKAVNNPITMNVFTVRDIPTKSSLPSHCKTPALRVVNPSVIL